MTHTLAVHIADYVHAPRFYDTQHTHPKSQTRNRFSGDQTLKGLVCTILQFRCDSASISNVYVLLVCMHDLSGTSHPSHALPAHPSRSSEALHPSCFLVVDNEAWSVRLDQLKITKTLQVKLQSMRPGKEPNTEFIDERQPSGLVVQRPEQADMHISGAWNYRERFNQR